MIKLKNILIESLEESMDVQKFESGIQKAHTFNDFLNSLVGKKMQDLLDAASFANLYILNKYSIGSEQDEEDIKVLLNRLLTATSTYINWKKIGPLRAKLDAVDKARSETPEFKEYHKQLTGLLRQIFQARKDGNNELANKLIADKAKLVVPDINGSYSKDMEDMQVLVKQFHNSKLSLADIMPSPDDRPEDKKAYEKAEKAFIALKNRMLS